MSKEIRIGATEPAPDSPAFAVSRDSAGILIGVRDKAAPQFAVSRDAGGLLLSAWPVTLPPAYVVSGYVLGLVAETIVRVSVVYWEASTHQQWETYTEITTSLTEWQRVSHAQPIPAGADYVSAIISCPRASPAGAYWTAMQLESGTVASPYGVGAANLLLNSEFATDLSHWWGNIYPPRPDPLPPVFSREGSLPSSPVPGVTTALKYTDIGNFPGVFNIAVQDFVALPTP